MGPISENFKYPLSFRQKLEFMRTIETLVSETMGPPNEVAAFFVDMVSGR